MTVKELYQEFKDVFITWDDKSYQSSLRVLKNNRHNLIEEDFKELERILYEEEHTQFVPRILEFVESFPEYLFNPLIDQLIKTNNNEFIDPCLRVFGGIKTNKKIQEIIKNSKGRIKCNALFMLYYCIDAEYLWDETTESYEVDLSNLAVLNNDNSKLHNRSSLIFDVNSDKEYFVLNESFLFDRYSFLLSEFLNESNNLIEKYFINLLLPKKLSVYPFKLEETAKKVIKLSKKLKIPDNMTDLEKRIQGDKELEMYAVDELKWDIKRITPAKKSYPPWKGWAQFLA
ncbi:hypothetical protein [Fulvivirga ligni]|uniref:hypothetical protein n=1 Tax=Fulvivirga ligni TaxID=2904246 RepID=UPI001F1C75E3|nr:hypothetical protein [Fulvivirga ligni]UII20538.1 hypothetical protein LVD16_22110 [Fulvivirga ligni]